MNLLALTPIRQLADFPLSLERGGFVKRRE